MTAERVHVADINRQVVPRLPLNVERRVHRIGKLIVPCVDAQIEGLVPGLKMSGIGQVECRPVLASGPAMVVGFLRAEAEDSRPKGRQAR